MRNCERKIPIELLFVEALLYKKKTNEGDVI